MKMSIYNLYDRSIGEAVSTFQAKSDAQAMRTLKSVVLNDPVAAEDFALYRSGQIEVDQMILVPGDRTLVADGLSIIAKAKEATNA